MICSIWARFEEQHEEKGLGLRIEKWELNVL